MISVITRRLLISVPMLFIIASFAFALVNMIPGDPVAGILGSDASEEQYAAVRAQLGLDRPLIVQYGDFLLGVLRLDLGSSLQTGQAVTAAIGQRMPVTISLSLLSIVVTLVVGVGLGLVGALRGKFAGRIAQIISILGISVPNFWLGVLLILVFSLTLGWLPATGYVPLDRDPGGWARALVLPVITIALAGVAAISRQTRASMNEALAKDNVRTLLAAGTPRRTIIFKHALRNASIPVVTSLGFAFINIFGGAIIVEQVFALPGLGQLTISAISSKDIPMIQGIIVCTALVVLLVNLVVDVMYVILNPKVR